MSKSLTVCSEWRPGLSSGKFKTVHHQGLVARAAAPPPLLRNAAHYWANFHRWFCFLDYLIRNTCIRVGEVLNEHRCNPVWDVFGTCKLLFNCKYSISPALSNACWTLRISWSFLPSVGFPCLPMKAMTFYLGGLLHGILQCWWSCEVLECLAEYEYEI